MTQASENLLVPGPAGWSDAVSGFDGPQLWDYVLVKEEARLRRHGRTATILLAEIGGTPEIAASFGAGAAAEAFDAACHTIGRELRSSDHAARVGDVRLGILLIETDEVAAINCVDRIRATFERELGSRLPLTLSCGWASPTQPQSLADAHRAALEMLETELRAAAGRRAEALRPKERPRRRQDPWSDLEGVAAAAERRRRAIRERIAFGAAAIADVGAFASWLALLMGLIRIPALH